MIYVDSALVSYVKARNFAELDSHDISVISRKDIIPHLNKDNFFVSWANRCNSIKNAIMETGFFRCSIHIDTVGLYSQCSLNFPQAREIIESYNAPHSWDDLNRICTIGSKFSQPTTTKEWDGMVAICQNPDDRSILEVGSTTNYYRFIEDAAKYYGKRLLFKIHPITIKNDKEIQFLEQTALRHGCELHNIDVSVIDKAEAVLTYNSTFAIDAIVRGKQVLQFAPGYFWQSGIVQYTGRSLTSHIRPVNPEFMNKFLEFLVWKYCICYLTDIKSMSDIIRTFASSSEMFPLPETLSYAHWWIENKK